LGAGEKRDSRGSKRIREIEKLTRLQNGGGKRKDANGATQMCVEGWKIGWPNGFEANLGVEKGERSHERIEERPVFVQSKI